MTRRLLPLLALLMLAPMLIAAAPNVETFDNGLRCIVQPTTSSQVVSVEVLVGFSVLDEPSFYRGLREVLLRSMLQGSRLYSGSEIQRKLTAAGGVMEGRIHPDVMEFTVTVPAGSLRLALGALSEVLCHPALTDTGIRDAVTQARMAVEAPPAGALALAAEVSRQTMSGDFFTTRGEVSETLNRITPVLARSAYGAYVIPGGTVVAVAGRCKPTEVQAALREAFAEWTAHAPYPQPDTEWRRLEQSHLDLREAPVDNTCIMLTFPVCGNTDRDFLTLRLIDAILSGGTGSRLFRVVREQRHLAYEAATQFPARAAQGQYSVYALMRGNNLEEVKDALLAEVERLQTELVTTAELQRARMQVKGRYQLSHQYSAQYAFDLAWFELTGQGVAQDKALATAVDRISAAEVQRVAREYFTHYFLIVVLPQIWSDTVSGIPHAQERSQMAGRLMTK